MLWITLWKKLGKQPLKFTQHNHVWALLENPKTHRWNKVKLDLRMDAAGHPFFIQSRDNSEGAERRKRNVKR